MIICLGHEIELNITFQVELLSSCLRLEFTTEVHGGNHLEIIEKRHSLSHKVRFPQCMQRPSKKCIQEPSTGEPRFLRKEEQMPDVCKRKEGSTLLDAAQ